MQGMKKFLHIALLIPMLSLGTPAALIPLAMAAAPSSTTPIFFQPYSAGLDAPAKRSIESVAKAALRAPGLALTVTGAADNAGSKLFSQYLSEARAQMVADTLVADGVSRGRITTYGAGTVPNRAAKGQPAQSARRVLIQLGG